MLSFELAFYIVIIILLIVHVYQDHILPWMTMQAYISAPMLPLVILYYQPSCVACHRFWPYWEAAKRQHYDKRVLFVEKDETIHTKGIVKYPTVLMVNDGVTSEYMGPADNKQLAEWINMQMSRNWPKTI